MTGWLEPAAHRRAVVGVPDTWPAARALAELRATGTAFAVVEDDERPLSLLTAADLDGLGDDTLHDHLEGLPALVLVDASTGILDVDDLVHLARLLMDGGANGFGLEQNGTIVGAVDAEDVDAALPVDAIGSDRLAGNPGVTSRWYVCRKCVPAPSRRSPVAVLQPPTCPRNWLHGAMDPET